MEHTLSRPSDVAVVAVLATADTVAAAVEMAVDTVDTGESARLAARAARLGAGTVPSSSETILRVTGGFFEGGNGGENYRKLT